MIITIGSGDGLVQQAINGTTIDQVPWCLMASPGANGLTHLPLVPHICTSESCQHWFRKWLVTYSAPSHYLNQCWVIVNWTLRNKLQRNFSKKITFSFKKAHLKMSSAKWRLFCPGEDEFKNYIISLCIKLERVITMSMEYKKTNYQGQLKHHVVIIRSMFHLFKRYKPPTKILPTMIILLIWQTNHC